MARNRVIYQSEALFVTHQTTGNQTIDIVTNGLGGVGGAKSELNLDHGDIPADAMHQIHRVQSANYNFAINRTDINQFGQLARIDTAVIDAPTVGLDFTYLVTNGTYENIYGNMPPFGLGVAGKLEPVGKAHETFQQRLETK